MFPRPQPKGYPPELEPVFNELRQEVTFLHSMWDTYQGLFGTQEAIDALNAVAPGAFKMIQYATRREVIMGISRITDPKETGHGKKAKQNLTLAQVVHIIETKAPEPAFTARLTERVEFINKHCESIRDRRNREMGHLDLATALNQHERPLPAVAIEQLGTAVNLVAEFMNEVIGHYVAAYADFVPLLSGPARNIVHALREFERLRKAEYQREIAELRAEGEARRKAEGGADDRQALLSVKGVCQACVRIQPGNGGNRPRPVR